ncbi:dihydrofolate reductase family protein [Streptomyces sp. NPDC127117]|uniref:dihydrofolate reductase family protein n=1 Tax=Streptomyces sp. NPDC127117 TaxID=3345368 RepID=UPI00362AF413
MRRLTYFIGCSVDGFIAGPDGQHDSSGFDGDLKAAILAEHPETIPDRLRGLLGVVTTANRKFDTVVMGRGAYEAARASSTTSPYPHLRQYVFSSTLLPPDPKTAVVAGDPVEFVRALKREPGMGIWLCGGAVLAGQLLGEIDELVVHRYPVVFGDGIPLFHTSFALSHFTLTGSRVFTTGTTVTTYAKQ